MFSTEYSIWFLPLCLVLGLAYAAILYLKSDRPELPVWVRRTAFGLRTLSVATIAFLLLNPVARRVVKEVEKPIVLVGIDNSSSLTIGHKASFYQGQFKEDLQKLLDDLDQDYTVEPYLLGDSLREGSEVNFEDQQTNLSTFFEQIQTVYTHRNVGAVVLLSDGVFNAGNNPYYIADKIKQPVYTVSMGDTTIHKDVLIAQVNYNKSVFRNNLFPIEILVKANKFNGQTFRLNIHKDDQLIYEKDIYSNASVFSEWVRMNFEASGTGLQRYRITLSEVDGELTKENNRKDIFIEVTDQRKKIAIVYHAPHPDVAAISRSLENSEMYQVEAFSVDKFNGRLGDYDVMVLHGLPSVKNPANSLIAGIRQMGIPCFYVLAGQINYAQFNQLETGVRVLINKDMTNDAFPVYNPNYADFTASTSLQRLFPAFPPVKTPFGTFNKAASASIMLYQKIGAVTTDYPLFVVNQDAENKTAVFLGDGLWRWRLYNYMSENHHEEFDELISKLFHFLSVKADKSFFRVMGKNVYSENENIRFDAELYNPNYELINDPEVTMTITGKDKKNYVFVFSRSFKTYHLDAGLFPEGDYTWEAKTTFNKENYVKTGRFSVEKINLETINLIADYQLMNNLAALNNGRNFPDDSLSSVYNAIKENKEIKSTAHYNKHYTSLLDSLLLLLCITLLLSTEWILRKWSGAY
ncbi:MAG: hypothetical protein LBQ64_00445 [Bacteroidales bacterium]|jgi:hypothetical protein|nr:hypothetical protein [Bacteroidales bacterium]